ncbi:restriction endonuclease subunit S [Megasphaera paucivorans]|uniref:Type I restriction enzyme, S subunit n=1 Tax=Megasphaera paucivorans TaxID=349095 RepID=A0A1G9Y5R9_9FIRM|nr:restriction endonuclease subunit S [Megasphaera paucivorans]SDN03901.1 type I restriction enzyme, S subunit [Megasphaera paucivorans]
MSEWEKTRLGDVIETNTISYSTKEGWKFVNYLDTGNITENVVAEIQRIDLNTEKLPSRAKRKVHYNSILYSTVRPNQRHYGIVKEQPENFLVSTGFTVIDADEFKVDADFLYFFLSQDNLVELLHSIAEQSVSTYPSIKASDIENIEVELPPLVEQKRIASILNALSDKIRQNTEINKNLEQQVELLFADCFLNLSEIPDGWKESNLLEIADYLNGLAMQKYRPEADEKGIPVLKIKELRQGFCDSSSELCTPSIKSEYIIHDGDVIFSWSGSLLVDLWCGDICGLNQHLFKVTSSKYDKWFYYAWTAHYLSRFAAIAADKATTMGHIKREDLGKAKVLIPSDEDYHRIGVLLQPIYDLIISNKIENRQLASVRDSLLPKLMSGELDVSNTDI